ncbi:MAG: hypothetical protein QF415_02000 [Candidatus Undinarchaeales archaeon]|jgi:hypothetical protein|nr:hypothetical protein [Candidatus Undinarchaeales archaeon]MDP7493462.1 hypothetical protein [Candidatus Undinarchaeales archaeon]
MTKNIAAVVLIALLLMNTLGTAAVRGTSYASRNRGGGNNAFEKIADVFEEFAEAVFGEETFIQARYECNALERSGYIMNGSCRDFPLMLFFFLIPAILMFAILYDMLLFMGFMRKWTAQVIAFCLAIFAARTGAYFNLAVELTSLFNDTLVAMISLLFTMMIFWWTLGHILYGFNLNRQILHSKNAIQYLSEVGRTIEGRGQ